VSIDARLGPPDPPTGPNLIVNPLQRSTGSYQVDVRAPAQPTVELANRLFRAPERWGWEYVEPVPPAPYPHPAPQWVEPLLPDIRHLEYKMQQAKQKMPKRMLWAGILGLLGLMTVALGGFGLILLLIGMGIGGFAIYEANSPQGEINKAKAAAAARRAAVWGQHQQALQHWTGLKAQHNAAEMHRHGLAPLLYPLAPSARASRVDVVGGTADGWAALLATMGSSVITAGGAVTVVDLTGHHVTGPLETLAGVVGAPVQSAAAPAALEASWLLGGLSPRDLADVLAESMESLRGGRDSVDLAAMDAEIIYAVAKRLDAPLTFDRLVAGVQVLRATYEHDDDSVLSAAEVARLTERVDLIDKGERMRDELRFIESRLSVLGAGERRTSLAKGSADRLWPSSGLAVVRSEESNLSKKNFIDRVLFHTVTHYLVSTPATASNAMLVVVGADGLDRAALETMARNAYRARLRLVFIFEHLRDAAKDLLGGGDSVALLMRMGNAQEAGAAAEYIGRGHTFQLSQLSKQVGTSQTETDSYSTTETEGQSVTETKGGGRSSGDSWSRGVTDTWSTSYTTGRSFSEGRSETDGVVVQRSYEFTVEPTQLQDLEPTVFLLVDGGGGAAGRRVRVADCFPGSVYVPRLSPTPR
jgi:hypothetical protein